MKISADHSVMLVVMEMLMLVDLCWLVTDCSDLRARTDPPGSAADRHHG